MQTTQIISIYDYQQKLKNWTTPNYVLFFYYDDIPTYIKQHNSIHNLQNNSKIIYKQIK